MQELNKLGRKGLACSFLVIISEQYKTPNRKCIGHKTFVTSSTTLIQIRCLTTSCFSDRASWIDYILITNLMHWLLFIHKILFFSTCFETQVLIFRRIQLYTCIIWYCHSLWEFLVACRYTAWRPPGTLKERDSIICFLCTTVSSCRWAHEARNM